MHERFSNSGGSAPKVYAYALTPPISAIFQILNSIRHEAHNSYPTPLTTGPPFDTALVNEMFLYAWLSTDVLDVRSLRSHFFPIVMSFEM